jgi:hypothetical protein
LGSRPGPASPARRGKSFIGGGRKSVRSSLFVGAMVAARHNPHLKSFRDKLVAAGKSKLVALVAASPCVCPREDLGG